ncbi:DUF2917 domain-containing protein [Chitinibacter sp. S2-10]|uniref:DUF2917 domain-containing protein n=1 Tax=Chitinibacter sp. S2-10 TaxID=3373597 RepID=UPI003977BF1A
MHTLLLSKSKLSTLSGHSQLWIECESGMVWLSDDGVDVILKRGEQWQIRSNEPVVIEALTESRLQCREPVHLVSSLLQAIHYRLTELLRQHWYKPSVKTI